MRKQVPEWSVHDDARQIERTYAFKTFAAAFAFVRKAADLAEAEGHHLDFRFGWGYATISLKTKKIKGLHENDFIMAAKPDNISLGPRYDGTGASPDAVRGFAGMPISRQEDPSERWLFMAEAWYSPRPHQREFGSRI
ncbi:4a-hydroxytetrahydrobiopterin dehydratase [Microvirga lenta]|uniref:4a-hydroxytetrahydrobiopterin dehydratase n=1 Tax=Microvirga lenta TaxID=2881337 RepID=UPI00299DB2F5|nr:4a-hydroxytetrahydrobiopterin dehydratase [Microvirga lenta]